jgi:hypothetical protein
MKTTSEKSAAKGSKETSKSTERQSSGGAKKTSTKK